ncbi:MAG: substrate-binding domain-containing protein [Geminicoccaceae bacterium]
MRNKADTLGLVAVDHPKVSTAVAECTQAGVQVFALLSQLNAPDLAGYVGIDRRRAGRTAGWVMSRCTAGHGDVGILIGSHRYLGHEEREVGFRSYMREVAPRTRLRESVVYLDDAAVAYEAAAEILRGVPRISGLYHCGGGVEGVIRALVEAERSHDVFYICHEKNPDAIQGLLDGTVDLVITNPLQPLARTITQAMADVLTGNIRLTAAGMLAFELTTAENI